MEAQVERLSRDVLALIDAGGSGPRVIIGISGVPGSGKTTLSTAVSARINELYRERSRSSQSSNDAPPEPLAVSISMDGFHYSRAHLAAMPNAAEAIHRRGAAFTFDAEGSLALISRLADDTSARGVIYAPSFGHEIKDPVADAVAIAPTSRVVLVEGNYCALDREPWRRAAALMTRLWYVDAPPAVVHARLAARHLASGIVADEREAWERATGTDELNAQDIRNNLLQVDEIISADQLTIN
ncbi:hypothetical protein PFICI_10678 [Pestalotiopsis fici W106-1]|uniref:Phosphoribulokinase/uridine kinase domain-containing protein n=1 Tax=Pestalotiopsis fici (strain W106-1 / CGMCC3.15140) TaxID=1229662 RepID=W3X0E9_PESFW|nr:uncharacterized protein PFICI_10678 [Pestalotiopsis fici W106-1]ETS78616.1 hypothetical protein PFICI_10678 [Pestalotiopsis fici W106-1]